uniref:Uncharacterized protein AlNc14C125G6801 n=1 Tax=Albugo laibachii Nc14 TaxID=890382 RepID=F0WJS6_9STRA|nr:conserved hypothetical protein [Albugo laibachii Nc14]|eukprot:CCA21527.1 conserved hypothetical protein [Albugo laibachii Nc14]
MANESVRFLGENMATFWSTMTYFLLPPAVVLLLLLTIPFPFLRLNRAIVRFADLVFSLEIGTIKIFHLITVISFVVLAAQTYELQKRYPTKYDHHLEAHYAADLQERAKRWRFERNWWISALTFTIYWMLLRFHALKKELVYQKNGPKPATKPATPAPKRTGHPISPPTDLWDVSCTKLTQKLQENAASWYEIASNVPRKPSNTAVPTKFQSLLEAIQRERCPKTGSLDPVKYQSLWNQLQVHAKALYDNAMSQFASSKAKGKLSSDEKYLSTLRKSGTLADRVAALTLTIQSAPFFSIQSLVQLMGMARKHARREASMAIRSLQDLFLETFLPSDRALLFFHQQSLLNISFPLLLVWYHENQLKTVFAQFISILSNGMNDSILTFQKSCILANHTLLSSKPEQERVLLAMLTNKLGDASGKIVSMVHALLRQLLELHPHMKHVISQEVEQLIRKKTTDNQAQARVQLQALVFLTQIHFQRTSKDAALASHLITLYFGIFTDAINQPDNALDRKVLSVLLIGVNRAFPYANSTHFQEELDALFRIVHQAYAFHTSVQALMLIFQVLQGTNAISDRFYIALYAKLWDPKLRKTAKHTSFLNLVFRALKNDPSVPRSAAIIKRLLQVALLMPPPFICAILYLISEFSAEKKILRNLWTEAEIVVSEKTDDMEEEVDDGEEKQAEKVLTELFGTLPRPHARNCENYDFHKRNPLFAAGDRSCAWELSQLKMHVHPSVRHFARQLLTDGDISYSGDPLVDFTLSSFLDKFVSKKPRKLVAEKKTAQVFHIQEPNVVEASEQFFYKFFQLKEERHPRVEVDANSDVSEEAFAMELAEGLLEDEFDHEDVDMSDWSGPESEEKEEVHERIERKSPFVCAEEFHSRKKPKNRMIFTLLSLASLTLIAGDIVIPVELQHEFEQQMDALQVDLEAWKQSEAGRYALREGFYTEDAYESLDTDHLGRFFLSQIAMRQAQIANPSAVFSMDTPFSLMTEYEFARFVGKSFLIQACPLREINTTSISPPKSVDWTSSKCLAKPKDQGMCGSCWAFAAIGALESALCLNGKNQTLTLLSEQQVNDCDAKSYGCNGGFPRNALEYIRGNNGVCTAEAYPYVSGSSGKDGKCGETNCAVDMDIHVDGVGGSEDAFVRAISAQPIAVGVAAGNREWKQYKSGVLSTCSTSELDHAVLAVGYGEQSSGKFFKIKNSWGRVWGDNGFMYLKRNGSESACGVINEHAVYPTILDFEIFAIFAILTLLEPFRALQ